jgi:hypothetical protein
MADDDKPDDENSDLGWPKHDRTAAPEIGLFVSETELYWRLGVGAKTGRIAVGTLERHGFPPKQPLWGNKRYWPVVRHFLDRYYGLTERREQYYGDREDWSVPPRKRRLTRRT